MTRRLLVLCSMVLALVTAACGDDSPSVDSSSATSSKDTLQVAKTDKFGDVLVDSDGMTLYLFTKDSDGSSACTGTCAATWPPLREAGKATAGKGLDASKLGSLVRTDGEPQVTFAGKPLYRYGADQKAGDVNGQGVGGVWFAVRPDGSQASAAGASGVPSY